MRVQLRNQPLSILPYHPRRLDARLVIPEADFRIEAGHPHVVAGFPVAFRVSKIDDVDRVMSGSLGRCHVSKIPNESTGLHQSTRAPEHPCTRAPALTKDTKYSNDSSKTPSRVLRAFVM